MFCGQMGRLVQTWTVRTSPIAPERMISTEVRSPLVEVPWLPIWVATWCWAASSRVGAFPDIVRQRLFTIDVLAPPNRGSRRDGMLVIGSADDDRVDVALAVEHDAKIVELGRLGIAPEGRSRSALIDITQGDDIFGASDGCQVAAAPAAGTDEGDVQLIIGPQPARFIRQCRARPKAPRGGQARGRGYGGGFEKIAAVALVHRELLYDLLRWRAGCIGWSKRDCANVWSIVGQCKRILGIAVWPILPETIRWSTDSSVRPLTPLPRWFMKQFCYVIVNNAGHSWPALANSDMNAAGEPTSALAQFLNEGWEPIRETPMGGGTSQLAHSLILLERTITKTKSGRAAKG